MRTATHIIMISFLRFAFLITAAVSIYSCASSNIYIVRHAEKDNTTCNCDPILLEPEGVDRSMDLKDFLLKKHITRIYSTNTHRNIQLFTEIVLRSKVRRPI